LPDHDSGRRRGRRQSGEGFILHSRRTATATFLSEDRGNKTASPEKSSTYENQKAELTAPLTPETPKQTQIDAQNLLSDPAEIEAAWPHLPEHIKAAILALLKAV
jgi:hypothetical protein